MKQAQIHSHELIISKYEKNMASERMSLRAHWGSWMIIVAESSLAFQWPVVRTKSDEETEEE